MSADKQPEAAELPSQPFIPTPTVIPAAPWHKPGRSSLRDTIRIILPVTFFLHFLITGTVILIYTLYLQEQIPPKYSIGAAVTFGVLITLILSGHLLLYCRKRFGHGAESGSRSGSERTNGTTERWAWLQALKKYLVEYESKSRDGFRGFHQRQRRKSYPKASKIELLVSLDQKLDSLNKKLDGRLSKLLAATGGREGSATPSILALPEPPLQRNPEVEREVTQMPDASELCATNDKGKAPPEAGHVRTAVYEGPVRTTVYERPNDAKQSFEMDATLNSNLPSAPAVPPKLIRKRVPNPIRNIIANDHGTLPSMIAALTSPSSGIYWRSPKNYEIRKSSVVPPEDQLLHRHDSPDIIVQPTVRPQMERPAATPNSAPKAAPEKWQGAAVSIQAGPNREYRAQSPNDRNEQIRIITRERLEEQPLHNPIPQRSYTAYRKPSTPPPRQSTCTLDPAISPNLDAVPSSSHSDSDVSPMLECATLARPTAKETLKLPVAHFFLTDPTAASVAFASSSAADPSSKALDFAAHRTRIPIAKRKLFSLLGRS